MAPDRAATAEALEQGIDRLKEQLHACHILCLQEGGGAIEAGFARLDLHQSMREIWESATMRSTLPSGSFSL